MFSVQLLRFYDVETLEQAENLLEESKVLDETVEDELWPMHEVLTKRWNSVDLFDEGINDILSGTRETVSFMIAEGYNERPKRKESWIDGGQLVPKEDRINITKYKSIFFEHDNCVYAAIIMPLSANINTYCSDLFPEEIWGSHIKEPAEFTLSKDFFYWMLDVFTRRNKYVSPVDPTIRIRSWTGFHGFTQDSVHRLSGEGDQISAILGTLAFLFMDDPFKSLSINIQYERERIPVVLWSNGSLTIDEYEYEGMFSNGFHDDKRKVLLSILMYTKVLPDIFRAYEKAKDSDSWNDIIKDDFRHHIGDQIITRVRDELQI